jgi:hypothetical protein
MDESEGSDLGSEGEQLRLQSIQEVLEGTPDGLMHMVYHKMVPEERRLRVEFFSPYPAEKQAIAICTSLLLWVLSGFKDLPREFQLTATIVMQFGTLDPADSNVHGTYPFPPRTIAAAQANLRLLFDYILDRPNSRPLSIASTTKSHRQQHFCAPPFSQPLFASDLARLHSISLLFAFSLIRLYLCSSLFVFDSVSQKI